MSINHDERTLALKKMLVAIREGLQVLVNATPIVPLKRLAEISECTDTIEQYFFELLNHSTGNYKEYLDSEQWQRVRSQRVSMDSCKCVRCGSGKNLQVHHKTYERRGFEHLDDLETLCERCHKEEHERKIHEILGKNHWNDFASDFATPKLRHGDKFDNFWSVVTKKVGKEQAKKIYKRQEAKYSTEHMLEKATAYYGRNVEKKFLKHPAKFLAECLDDNPEDWN